MERRDAGPVAKDSAPVTSALSPASMTSHPCHYNTREIVKIKPWNPTTSGIGYGETAMPPRFLSFRNRI